MTHLLWRTGAAGAPLEYWSARVKNELSKRFGCSSYNDYIEAVRLVRTSPNGLFGSKVFFAHMLDAYENGVDLDKSLEVEHVVRLRRRDRQAQAKSLKMSIETGLWTSFSNDSQREPRLSTSTDDLDAAYRILDWQEKGWDEFLRAKGGALIDIYYEDIVEDPDGIVAQVCDFLSVTADRHPVRSIPMPIKLTEDK